LQLLERQRLKHGEVQVFGTPRRLVVRYFTFLAQFLFIDAFHFCNS
jgi:glycyl-tRNA synthetase beta subunit